MPKNEWEDDVETWQDVTYIHVRMYLLCSSNLYTKEQLNNYKSLYLSKFSQRMGSRSL